MGYIDTFGGKILGGSKRSLRRLLFSASEPGFTFEPWDITTLYQDRAGTTPVTAAGQSVGLRLSKDQGLRQGPELVTNGDFSAGTTGWTANTATLSDNSGRLQIVSTGGNQGASQIVPTSIGKWYSLSVTIISANANYNIGYGTGFAFGNVYDSGQLSGARTFTAKIFGTGTSQTFWFFCQAAGTYIIDNISVRELAGNHEVAVSDAKRGIYGWMPKTGRRNRLIWTDPNGALPTGWSAFNASGTNSRTLVPAFGEVATKYPSHNAIKFEATNGRAGITQTISVTAGEQITLSAYIEPGGVSSGDGGAIVLWAYGASTGVSVTKSITDADANDRITLSFTPASSGTVDIIYGAGVAAAVTADVTMTAPQLVVGSSATAYQRVSSQYDITEAGVPTCYYVQADGVDDAYVTPTITPNTDKVQVFAGVRKLSDAADGVVIQFGDPGSLNNGSLRIDAPGSGAVAKYQLVSRGTTTVVPFTVSATFNAPVTNVVAGLGDISGDAATLRVNGAQVSQSTADQGTGNYLAYPAYLYARGGTTLPFNGLDFGHAVRFGPNLDAATIARVEALIARNTPGVTL